jgi:hypothetical protein
LVTRVCGRPFPLNHPVDSRQSFIVKDGKIAWNSLKAQTKGGAKEVQKALDGPKQ